MDVGAELKRARIARAKYIPQIAHEIKTTAPIIQAIERSDFAQCGGDAECQRLVRAFAAAVGIDADPLLNALVESGGVAGIQAAQAAAELAALEAKKALAIQVAEVKAAVHQAALDKATAEAAAARQAEAAEAEAKQSAKRMAAAQKIAAKAAQKERRAAEKVASRAASAKPIAEPLAVRKPEPKMQRPESLPQKAADPVKVLRDGANRTAAKAQAAGNAAPSRSQLWMLISAGVLVVAGVVWALLARGTPAPAVSEGPSPSATTSVTPTETATVTPTEPASPADTATVVPTNTATPQPPAVYRVTKVNGLISMRITCLLPTSLHVYNASGTIFRGRMKAGTVKRFTSDTDATFTTANAAGFQLSVSGQNFGTLGAPGQAYTHEFRIG